jgi:hypothetical protein
MADLVARAAASEQRAVSGNRLRSEEVFELREGDGAQQPAVEPGW